MEKDYQLMDLSNIDVDLNLQTSTDAGDEMPDKIVELHELLKTWHLELIAEHLIGKSNNTLCVF